MTSEKLRKTDDGKGARAKRVLRPLAPEMRLAEFKLLGVDAHHPTAPLQKKNGAVGARRPPRLLNGLLRWHHRRGGSWRRRSTGCGNLGLEFLDILLNDRSYGALFA